MADIVNVPCSGLGETLDRPPTEDAKSGATGSPMDGGLERREERLSIGADHAAKQTPPETSVNRPAVGGIDSLP